MHLGNAAITPECAAVTTLGAAAGLAWLAWSDRGSTRQQPTVASVVGWTAFVFAAQAWNLPVLPSASAHLVGGVLLARMLGPVLGASAMGIILAVQAFALGDGGWMAWGCNFLNMGLLPAITIHALNRLSPTSYASPAPTLAPALAAAATIVVAAVAICGEVLLFRSESLPTWSVFASHMLGVHLWIGLLEGTLTFAILHAVRSWETASPKGQSTWRVAAVVTSLMVVAAIGLGSSLPDGYEAALDAAGLAFLPAADVVDAWTSQLGLLVVGLAVAGVVSGAISATARLGSRRLA